MSWPGSFARRHGFDLLLVLAAVATALDVALRTDALRAPRTSHWFAVPAAALLVLPLLGRRRWPFAAPVAVWVLGVAVSYVDGRLIPFTAGATAAGLTASFLLGQVSANDRARLGLVVVLAGVAFTVYHDPLHAQSDLIFVPVPFAIAWLAGVAVRDRGVRAVAAEELARRAESERAATARAAVAEERARIARELHDIVAHAVSVIVLQVGAVRHHLPAHLEQDRDALRGVEQTGRTALTEMRRLLGAMHRDGEGAVDLTPQPRLNDLTRLVEDVGRAGLTVGLEVEGDPVVLPPTLDLSAYRVVQEGLTNALRHARASHADVLVRYQPHRLAVEIRDDGIGDSRGCDSGHGLLGVRERVKIYGGRMTAGAAPGGGFLLSADFPLDPDPK